MPPLAHSSGRNQYAPKRRANIRSHEAHRQGTATTEERRRRKGGLRALYAMNGDPWPITSLRRVRFRKIR